MKGKRIIPLLFVIILVLSGFSFIFSTSDIEVPINIYMKASAEFTGGTGSGSDPYQISNVTQLQAMKDDITAHYILVNEINASETRYWNEEKGFLPIGSESNQFSGSFDGNNHSIVNLFINRTTEFHIGLFGYVGEGAAIENASLVKIYSSGDHHVGGLAGYSNYSNIHNCSVSGELFGRLVVGGLIGLTHHGEIYDCNTSVIIDGKDVNMGCLIGYNYHGAVSRCHSSGRIEGDRAIGGLIGKDQQGIVSFCSSSSNVIGNVEQTGGLIGLGIIYRLTRCFSTGNVSGNNQVGGLIGELYSGRFTDCFSTGNVTGYSEVGGLVGFNDRGLINNSYSTGKSNGNNIVGGLVGLNNRHVINCYSICPVIGSYLTGGLVGENDDDGVVISSFWDKNLSGLMNSDGGTGKYTNEMINKTTYVSANWNLVTTWGIVDCDSYPYLRWFGYQGLIEISNNDLKSIKEDTLYYRDYNAISCLPGNIGAKWSLNTNASDWLTIKENGILSGVPSNDDVGECWVNITAFWHNNFDFSNFTLEVTNVNDDPIITTNMLLNATEDKNYSCILESIDIDPTGDNIMWMIESNAKFLNFNDQSGFLFGTPKNDDVGTWWVFVEAYDGNSGSSNVNLTLNVSNVNDRPEIVTLELSDIYEDEWFNYTFQAKDVDPTNDLLNWSYISDAQFLIFDTVVGNLTGIPTNDDVGEWWVLVNVSDGNGGFDEVNLTLEVLNVNDNPEILEIDIPLVFEDSSFFLDMDAVDMDPTNDELEWELITNAHFIGIDPYIGNLTGTPLNDDVGTWWINVSVSDGNGGSDRRNFTLTVLNVNDIPELNITELTLTMDEDSNGASFHLTDVFFDIDDDVLTYEHGVSGNLSISIEGENVTIIPDPDWCGTEIMKFNASDEFESASLNVTIDVTPINDVPTDVKIIAESRYVVGMDQIVNSSATDVDIPFGDELTFSWSSNISGEIGEGRSINLSLPVGHHLITLTVTDKEGLSATATFNIEIKPVEEDNGNGGDGSDDLPLALIVIIAIIVLVLIVVLVIFFLVRKKKPVGEPMVIEEKEVSDLGDENSPILTEEQPDVIMQQVQSHEENINSEMEPPMAETSLPEMNENDGQIIEPMPEEQIGNNILMESDVFPTETEEQVFQDGPENPLLEESEDLIS